ncbi:hypothetical protein [Marinobacter sp. CHS3-4]|uniref:hypothetical protein n=1 Tax=Marinobacter sp. CHS3-4 TaxID=3045174 RepID=UPI0024B62AF7|nr:hypothetical protein [Marinobacter sp. CHS3-4]MDI9246945.1 hypothetical protein [Marinobacter sp. CHS3-4]
MIIPSFKSVDEKLGFLLQSILRAVFGTIFYGLILYAVAHWVITSYWEGGAWYIEMTFYDRSAAELLLQMTGFICLGLGALMYLLIPVRHFAVFLIPWLILLLGLGLLILFA